jgi:hypothetical protein
MINETMFHDESAVFRAVTGSTYNIPNSYGSILSGSSFPVKGTIPVAVTRVGTFKTTGKAVRGTGTDFTKMIPGSYLYNGTVLRRVDYILSDTLLFLIQAFPSDVSVDTAVKVCDRQYYKMIYAKSTHETDAAILQEAPFRAGDTFLDGGAPVSYDATAGEISFSLHQ